MLAAEWLADFAGVDLSQNTDTALIGIGGHSAEVRFVDVELRLYAPEMGDEIISWRCDVGFVPDWQAPFALVLGQTGFLDQFTVTFHRGAATLVVEEWDAFDPTVRHRRVLRGPVAATSADFVRPSDCWQITVGSRRPAPLRSASASASASADQSGMRVSVVRHRRS